MPTYYKGVIHEFDQRAGYGYIRPADGQELGSQDLILVHRHSLRDRSVLLRPGDAVTFYVEMVPRGLLASDCHVDETGQSPDTEAPQDSSPGLIESPASYELLSKAILARDRRDYREAQRLYEKGLRECPSVQLVLSYAAMQKNANKRQQAMRIYLEGIRKFPTNAKLREDAGVMAASLGDDTRAVTLLREALELASQTGTGVIGVLLALARTYYDMDTVSALQSSLECYERAMAGFRKGKTMPAADLLQMNLARIRTQHHRGNLAVKFVWDCGFKIFKADLLGQHTEGADFFVQQVQHPDLTESYSLAGQLLLRCFFKANVLPSDLASIDQSVARWGKSELIDEQVALIVVGSLTDEMQRVLFARLEEKREALAAIVPVTQQDIETAKTPLDALREVLDTWLYRRDLFAGNLPVVGQRFFGREKPLAELRDAIATSTAAGVFGLRKVGKTSLLQECRRRSIETGDICIYVDLLNIPSEVSDCRWLYWKIAEYLHSGTQTHPHRSAFRDFKWRLGGQFMDLLDVPESFPVATAFDSDLSRLIDTIKRSSLNPKPKIVLLLDEIERLLPTRIGKQEFRGFFDFVSYFRGVSQATAEFVLIVTGANAAIAEAAQFDGRDNPVFNFFREIYLPHLELAECSKMIRVLGRGMGLRFDDAASHLIFRLTGGHPFFARQLCSFVAENNRSRPLNVTTRSIDAVVDHYLDARGKDFGEIVERLKRDFPDEHEVCVMLAKAGGALGLDQVRKAAGKAGTLRHLVGYQIIRVTGSRVALSMDLLTRWLQKREAAHA